MKKGNVEFDIDRLTVLPKHRRIIVDMRVTQPFRTMVYADFTGDEVPAALQEALTSWMNSIDETEQVIDATDVLK